MLTKLSQY